jgi:ATP-dependent DNA ligase
VLDFMQPVIARNGYNFADRFPRIVEAIAGLPVQSCFIDGEAIVVDETRRWLFGWAGQTGFDGA